MAIIRYNIRITVVVCFVLFNQWMVKAEAVEALLYGCVTWTTRLKHYRKSRTVHHRVLLRIIGARRRRSDHRVLAYNRALELTGYESIEATLRARRLLWAGALTCMDDGRLPKRVMFGKIKDGLGKRKSGRHAWKATSDLSRSNKTGITQPEMPRAGLK